MKRNALMGIMVATIAFANVSYADFTFHTNHSNACESLPGQWAGSGKASSWWIGECVYHGAGLISTLDRAGNFSLEVSADKDSGSFLCPNHATQQLAGICVNGVVTVKTDYGNLTGNFSNNAGTANGTLTVSPGINAEVTLSFARVG
jgi:hypothetical protein